MTYRTLGRTGIEDGDAPLHDERQSGLLLDVESARETYSLTEEDHLIAEATGGSPLGYAEP
jgi:hypothetical protein